LRFTDIHDAKTHLSQLIDRAVAGDPLVILVPYRLPVGERQGRQWQGRVWIAEDFDTLPVELAGALLGEEP
jgi:hypothetical protein